MAEFLGECSDSAKLVVACLILRLIIIVIAHDAFD